MTEPAYSTVDPEIVRTLPKVVLHDHLDGGLRPQTIIDIAAETGYDGLPTTDAAELVEAAKAAARKARFTESRAAVQGGTITYVFRME